MEYSLWSEGFLEEKTLEGVFLWEGCSSKAPPASQEVLNSYPLGFFLPALAQGINHLKKFSFIVTHVSIITWVIKIHILKRNIHRSTQCSATPQKKPDFNLLLYNYGQGLGMIF